VKCASGVDLGGTKIEIIALGDGGETRLRERVPTPTGDYRSIVRTIRDLVTNAEERLGQKATVGVAIPGTVSAKTGLVKNSNSTALLGHPLDKDLQSALVRTVRVANDANCFALSEATDGAGEGARTVFGIIAGTGVGAGICADGRVLLGPHAIAGEWGHNPLPAPSPAEVPGPRCYCGKTGCIEAWLSGPALEGQFRRLANRTLGAKEIAEAAGEGDVAALSVMENFYDRWARAIATVVNILDPDAIVMGGGLSNIAALYRELPERIARYAFTTEGPVPVLQNRHGDSSGVRGAAWLWGKDEASP